MRGGVKAMSLNKEYASFLIAASNIYAGQRSTKCSKVESQFERGLFKLFDQASNAGMDLQDMIVVASTAIAVMLTKYEALQAPQNPPAALASPTAPPDSNVIKLPVRRPRIAQ
jgi:hypothetical protein